MSSKIINEIKEIIKENDLTKLNNYFNENNINSKDFNNFNEILIYALENDASLDIIKLILKERDDKNLNYDLSSSYAPLFIALERNNFKAADFLIDNNADINYYSKNLNIINYLIEKNSINKKKLRYILGKKFKFDHKYSSIIENCIEYKQYTLIKIIFQHFKLNTEYILRLLELYKNYGNKEMEISEKKKIYNDFVNILVNQDKKLKVTEDMYYKCTSRRYKALRILYQYDGSDKIEMTFKMHKCNLLEKSLPLNDYDFIKSILSYEKFNYKSSNYTYILTECIKNMNEDKSSAEKKIGKLLIDQFIDSSSEISRNELKMVSSEFKKESQPVYKKYDIRYINVVLNIAISEGNLNIVKNMINNDEYKITADDINTADIIGNYPIIKAVEQDYPNKNEMVKFLLEKGADFDIKNRTGRSLIFIAIDKEETEIIELLIKYRIQKGMSMDITDADGTPLLFRAYETNYGIFKCLLHYANINKIDGNGNSILYKVIEEEDVGTFKNLINMGIDISSKNGKNQSILDILVLKASIKRNYNYLECLEYLLDNDKIDINSIFGDIPYSALGNEKLIGKLVIKGLDVNKIDKNGDTLLYFAAKKAMPTANNGKSTVSTVFDLIIKKTSKELLNKKSSNGDTPLHVAISEKKIEMIKKLLKYGADKNIKDKEGHNAEDLNKKCNYHELYNNYNYNPRNQTYYDIRKLLNYY